MPESRSHREAKARAAGPSGVTEVPLRGGRRLDALSGNTATEIERTGNTQRLVMAARRLEKSGAPRKVLVVPQPDLPKAVEAMKSARVGGTVRNIGGTQRRQVRKPRAH